MRRRGFTLIESLIALSIVMFGFLVIMSVFVTGSRGATLNRNRMTAFVLADNLLEEFREHTYGAPEPKSWRQDQSVIAVIEGRRQDVTYHVNIDYANGSFIGKGNGELSDDVTLRLSWREGTAVGGAGIDKSLTVKTSMRRAQ
jgi:type II secretory pathway pseudopilin PulG